MDLKEYTSQAIRTESRIADVSFHDKQTLLNVMELFILSGNLLDNIKKKIYYNKPIPDCWTDNVRQLGLAANSLAASEFVNNKVLNSDADKETLSVDPRLFHAMIGIATEGTELVEALYKSIRENVEMDTVNVLEEMFDAMWYVFIGHDALNKSLDDTLNVGFDKLKARYPEKFESNLAINRDVEAERTILEQVVSEQPE